MASAAREQRVHLHKIEAAGASATRHEASAAGGHAHGKPSTATRGREREVFYRYLQQKGLKRTTQREAVLEFFLGEHSHQTAEEIYNKLRVKHRNIGYSTVYRTLKLLKECDLAREVYFADGRMYFEHQFEMPHHDHMVCTQCGHTIEFFNATIEALQDQVAADNGFTPVRHTMVIFGVCAACGKKDGARA